MAKEPTSLFGHMMQATRQTFLAPVSFIANAGMQALERLIPHGASEVGNALYGGGNAYAPPGLTERVEKPDPPQVTPLEDYSARLERAAARSTNKERGQELGR